MLWLVTVVYVLFMVGILVNFWFKRRDYIAEIDRLNSTRAEAYERGRRLGRIEGLQERVDEQRS